MSSKELELVLMNITLILGAILVLLFIVRAIKVLTTKRIKSKDDALFVVGFLVLMCIIGYCVYKIKSAFKKDKKQVV